MEAVARRGLAIVERVGKPRDMIDWLDNVGSALRTQGKYAAAVDLWRRALKMEETLSGPDHRNT